MITQETEEKFHPLHSLFAIIKETFTIKGEIQPNENNKLRLAKFYANQGNFERMAQSFIGFFQKYNTDFRTDERASMLYFKLSNLIEKRYRFYFPFLDTVYDQFPYSPEYSLIESTYPSNIKQLEEYAIIHDLLK